jgi:primase-polymerase (primpol)-like protein
MPQPFSRRDFDGSRVPAELRLVPRWICWRHAVRDGKPTKVPTDPVNGFNVDPLDASHWMAFDDAVAACRDNITLAGVGFVFDGSDDLSGVDLDDCFDDLGNLNPEAADIVRQFGTYTERSPSGTGVKMFLRGRKPAGLTQCTSRAIEGISRVEIYDHGRFFTVTSMALPGGPGSLEQRQDQLRGLCARLCPEKAKRRAGPAPEGGFSRDDQALIEKAKAAVNGDKFSRLFAGDTSNYGGDDSAADQGLCCMLAFWTGKDKARMNALFRLSGLYRPKWDRPDYADRTLEFAIANCTETYAPSGRGRRTVSDQNNSGFVLVRIVLGTDEHRVVDEAVSALSADEDLYSGGVCSCGSCSRPPRPQAVPPP